MILLIELHLCRLLQQKTVTLQRGIDFVDITVDQVGIGHIVETGICDLEGALRLADIIEQHVAGSAGLGISIYGGVKYTFRLKYVFIGMSFLNDLYKTV